MKHDSDAREPKTYKRKIVNGSASEVQNEGEVNLVATSDVHVQKTGRENAKILQHKDHNNREGIHLDGTDSTDDVQSINSGEDKFFIENVLREDPFHITNRKKIPIGSVSVTNSPNGDNLVKNITHVPITIGAINQKVTADYILKKQKNPAMDLVCS